MISWVHGVHDLTYILIVPFMTSWAPTVSPMITTLLNCIITVRICTSWIRWRRRWEVSRTWSMWVATETIVWSTSVNSGCCSAGTSWTNGFTMESAFLISSMTRLRRSLNLFTGCPCKVTSRWSHSPQHEADRCFCWIGKKIVSDTSSSITKIIS